MASGGWLSRMLVTLKSPAFKVTTAGAATAATSGAALAQPTGQNGLRAVPLAVKLERFLSLNSPGTESCAGVSANVLLSAISAVRAVKTLFFIVLQVLPQSKPRADIPDLLSPLRWRRWSPAGAALRFPNRQSRCPAGRTRPSA